jgi:hypothetical protein
MKRRLSPVLASLLLLLGSVPPLRAQSMQVTWTDGTGISGSCLPVATESGQTASSGYYYCSQQSSSYDEAYCPDPANGMCYGSLYLPSDPTTGGAEGLTLEGITTTWGQPFNQTKDTKGRITGYSRTDHLVANDGGSTAATWSGSVTQSFHVSYGPYNFRCRCYPSTTTVLAGGGGTLTHQ